MEVGPEIPRPISWWFWQGFHKGFTCRSQLISYWFCKKFLAVSIWKGLRALHTNFMLILKRTPQGFHVEFPIDSERNSLKDFIWKLTKNGSWQSSHCFWKECLSFQCGIGPEISIFYFEKDSLTISIWKFAKGSPKQNSIEFERNSWRFPYGNWEICRSISNKFWKELFKGSIWELTQCSPDQFPIDFERGSSRISYENCKGNVSWSVKGIL